MFKRILSCVVTMLLLATMCCQAVSARATTTTFSLSVNDGKVGDTVTVSVSLSADSYFTNCTFYLHYDPNVVSFVTDSETPGPISPRTSMLYVMDHKDQQFVKGAYVTVSGIKKAGVLLSLDFTVLQEAATPFTLSFDECVGVDENDTEFDVSYQVAPCTLNAHAAPVATTTAAPVTTTTAAPVVTTTAPAPATTTTTAATPTATTTVAPVNPTTAATTAPTNAPGNLVPTVPTTTPTNAPTNAQDTPASTAPTTTTAAPTNAPSNPVPTAPTTAATNAQGRPLPIVTDAQGQTVPTTVVVDAQGNAVPLPLPTDTQGNTVPTTVPTDAQGHTLPTTIVTDAQGIGSVQVSTTAPADTTPTDPAEQPGGQSAPSVLGIVLIILACILIAGGVTVAAVLVRKKRAAVTAAVTDVPAETASEEAPVEVTSTDAE